MKKVFLFIATITMMLACTNDPAKNNPFLQEWNTPHGVPPFDKIKVEHYLPAFEEGIKQQQAEIDSIINNAQAPDFENTLVALDRSGELLSNVSLVFFNLIESDANDQMNAIMDSILPIVSEHNDNIYMNADLFKRVKSVYDGQDSIKYTTEQKRLITKVYNSFVRNGISLDSAEQNRLREINARLSALEQKFGQNVLAETNSFKLIIENEEDLAGLPENVRAAAAEKAKADSLEGKWEFGLQKPSWIPFMQYSEKRELREKMYKAYTERGNHDNENDNKAVVLEIMKLRIEKANLLGFDSSADFILDDTMAKKSETVNKFLDDIFKAANNKAKEELAELQKLADKDGIKIQAWDWDFYTEKLRKEKYALNEDEIKPYFKMENVREGIFAVANRLYGVKFEKLNNMPVYHSEVECFAVKDSDDSLLGIFYTDYFPRDTKSGGAWMTNFREQYINEKGRDIRPVIVNVANLTKPTGDTPSLLSLDEVETMFHEFGHAIHGLLAKANYKMVSGTNVARDFVEFPSQLNENWQFEPEVLAMYAKHYKTGEVIPKELVDKIQAVSTFNQGFMTTELTAAAILDMNWHDLKSLENISDPIKFEKDMMDKIGLIPEIAPRYRTTYYNHIWNGGYSAGYYSYLWAEVLDKDAFAYFKEKGIFDHETAQKLRTLLEHGDTEDPMVLYRNFRGAEPTIEALLVSRGLK